MRTTGILRPEPRERIACSHVFFPKRWAESFCLRPVYIHEVLSRGRTNFHQKIMCDSTRSLPSSAPRMFPEHPMNTLVGAPGIEPGLYAPEAHVLPVYYAPTKVFIQNRTHNLLKNYAPTKNSMPHYAGGPRENRTPASAMRMPRNTTLLWARVRRVAKACFHDLRARAQQALLMGSNCEQSVQAYLNTLE